MAIVFKASPPFTFSNVEGQQSDTKQVSFNNEVRAAEVALQSFSFDFEGVVDRSIDKVKVNTRVVDRPAGNDVTVQVTVHYAGKAPFEYNANVTVLVIAILDDDDR